MTATFQDLAQARAAGNRDEVSRIESELYAANIGLVHKFMQTEQARKTVDLVGSAEDVLQEVSLELVEAIQRFDLARGASFSTFAWWRLLRGLYRVGCGQLGQEAVRRPRGVRARQDAEDAQVCLALDEPESMDEGARISRLSETLSGADDPRQASILDLLDVDRLIEAADLTPRERETIADFMAGELSSPSRAGRRENKLHLDNALAKLRRAARVETETR